MFVGRTAEKGSALATLGALPSSVVVVGPPGIGKTSFCEAIAESLHRSGSAVSWGRAWELGGAPAFFPWQRVFASIADDLGDAGAPFRELSELLLHGSDEVDARARLRVFERAREAFEAAPRTLLVVLDDIHAADAASLELARYLQREQRSKKVGFLFSARDAEIEAADDRSGPLLRDLLRGASRTVALRGLAREELDEWLPWFCGRPVPRGLSGRLLALTAGNPFFVRELVEAQHGDLEAIAEDRPGVPRAIRDVIQRQVALLDATAQAVLRVAAVLGRDSMVEDVARLLDLPPTDVESVRERSTAARLTMPSHPDEIRFAHALVCHTLYVTMPTAERLALHGRIVDALAAPRLSERTRHAVEAALLGPEHAARAIALSREAGQAARRTLAFEEAARHYRAGLALAERASTPPALVAEIKLALGEALTAVGDREEAERTLAEAATTADALGDAHLFARAALLRASMREYVARDLSKLALLESALEKLGAEESDLTARVLGRLASDLVMDPTSRARRADIAARALAIAKQVGRPETIAVALEARLQSVYGPDTIEERLVTADEIVAHARNRGDVDREIAGRGWKLSALLERGDVLVALPLAREHAELAETRPNAGPRINAQSRLATLAFVAGRFEDGFAHARRAFDIGVAARDGGASLLHHAQLVLPCDLLGRKAPLADAVEVLAREAHQVTHGHAIKALRTIGLLSLGREDEARAELAALGATGFEDVPRDFARVGTLTALADIVVRVGDIPLAAALRPHLVSYAKHNAMVGTAACFGAVTRHLGRLATVLGTESDAIAFLEDACTSNARMHARPALAWSQLELARALLRTGRGATVDALVAASRATALELGLAPLLAELDAIAARATSTPKSVAPTKERRASLRREDRGWCLHLDGTTMRFASRRGLAYLARLVAAPGREVHALELVAPEGPTLPRETTAEQILDPKAKSALRSRLDELNADLAEAEQLGDPGRVDRVRVELEALEDHLAASLGAGGRSRRHSSAAERARIAVTVALKRAIAEISRESPEIAAHFERSVRTGLFCSYDPDPSTTFRVTT
ncbi:MAG: AAA family ATPase [Polyangiaceae bacterium]